MGLEKFAQKWRGIQSKLHTDPVETVVARNIIPFGCGLGMENPCFSLLGEVLRLPQIVEHGSAKDCREQSSLTKRKSSGRKFRCVDVHRLRLQGVNNSGPKFYGMQTSPVSSIRRGWKEGYSTIK